MFLSSRLRTLERSSNSFTFGLGRVRITVVSFLIGGMAVTSGLEYFTVSSEMSTGSVPKNHPLQNQSRSSPLASSIVRKKSAGEGCLNAQRLAYSLNA